MPALFHHRRAPKYPYTDNSIKRLARVRPSIGAATILRLGLGALLAFRLLWGWPLSDQERNVPEAGGPADTISLSKLVSVDNWYQVVSGDTLAKILKAWGLGGQ